MATNLLFIQISSSGTASFTLPQGFFTASILPVDSATYTITNSEGNLPGITTQVSSAVSNIYTFPILNGGQYDQHVITATSGTVEIWYITGI